MMVTWASDPVCKGAVDSGWLGYNITVLFSGFSSVD